MALSSNRKQACVLVVLFIVCTPSQAYAYLDPGTGSLLLQGLIAGLMAALVTIKIYWSRIKAFFGGSSGDKKGASDSPSDNGR